MYTYIYTYIYIYAHTYTNKLICCLKPIPVRNVAVQETVVHSQMSHQRAQGATLLCPPLYFAQHRSTRGRTANLGVLRLPRAGFIRLNSRG